MATKDNKYVNVSKKEPWFGLGRQLDFYSWSARIAILMTGGSILASLLWQTMHGAGAEESTEKSLYMGLIVFFTWLIAEELDPERHTGGVIGGGIALVMCLTLGVGNPVILLWMLFIIRLISRTSGSRHMIGDNILLLGISYFLCREGLWLVPTLTGVAYLLESQLKDGYFRSLYLSGLAFAIVAFATPSIGKPNLDVMYFYLMSVTFILFLPAITMAGVSKFLGERDRKPINPRRLQAALGCYLLFNFVLCWFHGNMIALDLAPTWAAGMGVGLGLLSLTIQKIMFKDKKEK